MSDAGRSAARKAEREGDVNSETPKKKRGFAVMSREENSRISALGGKAAHVAGTAHEWTKETAREAGRKGGKATSAKRKATGQTPE